VLYKRDDSRRQAIGICLFQYMDMDGWTMPFRAIGCEVVVAQSTGDFRLTMV
jgi:hypothetical protein